MEFFTEAKDKSQIDVAKREFQEVLRIITEIQFIEGVEINGNNQKLGDNPDKISNRLKNVKRK
jgi:hypothetical protein